LYTRYIYIPIFRPSSTISVRLIDNHRPHTVVLGVVLEGLCREYAVYWGSYRFNCGWNIWTEQL